MWQEAAGLSSLKADLNQLNVPLYGIVHEELGVDEFRSYLKGELLLDTEVACREK